MYRLALAAAALSAAACTGDLPPGGPADAAMGGTTDGPKADAKTLQWVDAAPGSGNNIPCENNNQTNGDGRHNTGKSCFDSCHGGNHGFTIAGTLYTNATGNTGFYGATITVVDANNQEIKIPTLANGNFYTRQAVAFPVLVVASSCPSAVRMNGSSPNGNCNSCHVGGTNSQMHLP